MLQKHSGYCCPTGKVNESSVAVGRENGCRAGGSALSRKAETNILSQDGSYTIEIRSAERENQTSMREVEINLSGSLRQKPGSERTERWLITSGPAALRARNIREV